MRKIIHIGLGKTGSTHLQEDVFLILDSLGILHYRKDLEIPIQEFISDFNILDRKIKSRINFFENEFSKDSVHLVSFESLLSWDPNGWIDSLDNIKQAFGSDSEILITFRDPLTYLRSVYQQMVHQGESDLLPENYFLDKEQYSKHLNFFGKSNQSRRFSIDEFNLDNLFNLILKDFSKVYFSSMRSTMNYQFLIDMNLIKPPTLEVLNKKNGKIHNKAYSNFAMNLDRKRFKFLKDLNLRPNSASIRLREKAERLISKKLKRSVSDQKFKYKLYKNNKHKIKYLNIPSFIKIFILHILRIITLPYFAITNWRYCLQNNINNLFNYNKFDLSPNVYLGKYIKSNQKFYEKLPLSVGYKKLNK